MYQTILVTLDGTPTDRAIIEHIKLLAGAMKSRVILLHVITSASARYLGPNAGGAEIEGARKYLAQIRDEYAALGIQADVELAFGEAVKEIVKYVRQSPCDLVAMSTHGHKFVADLVLGTTAISVQHNISVPVLLLRAK